MYRKLWFLTFPRIWYETYDLKRRQKKHNWSDRQYYRAMFSMAHLTPQVEGDKFGGLREHMTGAILQDRSSARVLDLATGVGYQARSIWSHGYERVYACDLVESRINLAQQHHSDTGIKFLVADMQHMGFPTAFFDAITISAALHDLPIAEVEDVLHECGRVLRPGGRLLLLEPRHIRDWPTYFRKFYAFVMDNLDESLNMRAFIDFDLAGTLRRNDFTLESTRTFWLGGLCLYIFIKGG